MAINVDSCSIEYLVYLGNSTSDAFDRDEIKKVITNKILALNDPMFVLLNKFKSSGKIFREAYARAILVRMNIEFFDLEDEEKFHINDEDIEQILDSVSLEDLCKYYCNLFSDILRDKFKKRICERIVLCDNDLMNNKPIRNNNTLCRRKHYRRKKVKGD